MFRRSNRKLLPSLKCHQHTCDIDAKDRMRAKFNDDLARLSHSYIADDVNRRVIKGWRRTTLRDIESRNHHARFSQMDKHTLEDRAAQRRGRLRKSNEELI